MKDSDRKKPYPDESFIEALENGKETTQAIADHVGCTRQAADYRLRQLKEAGRVDSRKVGGTLLWTLTDG